MLLCADGELDIPNTTPEGNIIVALTVAQARACYEGDWHERARAIARLTAVQFVRLFPGSKATHARNVRSIANVKREELLALMVTDEARAMLRAQLDALPFDGLRKVAVGKTAHEQLDVLQRLAVTGCRAKRAPATAPAANHTTAP